MIDRPLADVTLDDVVELQDHVQSETHTHELKGEIDIKSDKHKTMIAIQVSSFANATGGDLILGVPEKRSSLGLEGEPDDIELRIRAITRRRMDPNPPTLQVKALECGEGRHVYVVRVPRSWTAPHMLTEQNRFYTRDGNGKRLMDRFEIERAFAAASGREDDVYRFRRERVTALRNEARTSFSDPRLMVVHLVPLRPTSMPIGETAFDHRFSLVSLAGRPLFDGSRTTLDGLVLLSRGRKALDARATVYRTGRLEYVWTLASRMPLVHKEYGKAVLLEELERDLNECCRGLLGGLIEYGIEPPVCVMATLLGVKGHISWKRADSMTFHPDLVPRYACDRDELILDPVTVEGATWGDYPSVVNDLCSILWQCFGEDRNVRA